jgi:hypothetical protein
MHLQRPQIGKHAECGAQGQQALFRAHLGLRIGPLRPANRAEQNRIRALARFQRGGGQRLAGCVDRAAANGVRCELEAVSAAFGNGLQYGHGRVGNFRTYAVAGQGNDASLHAAFSC